MSHRCARSNTAHLVTQVHLEEFQYLPRLLWMLLSTVLGYVGIPLIFTSLEDPFRYGSFIGLLFNAVLFTIGVSIITMGVVLPILIALEAITTCSSKRNKYLVCMMAGVCFLSVTLGFYFLLPLLFRIYS